MHGQRRRGEVLIRKTVVRVVGFFAGPRHSRRKSAARDDIAWAFRNFSYCAASNNAMCFLVRATHDGPCATFPCTAHLLHRSRTGPSSFVCAPRRHEGPSVEKRYVCKHQNGCSGTPASLIKMDFCPRIAQSRHNQTHLRARDRDGAPLDARPICNFGAVEERRGRVRGPGRGCV